jgi:leucyl/phenylalanyl-tRNA---protein transferase
MPVYQLPEIIAFPDPSLADDDGLLAVGGDLTQERLILAYENGIFPWFNQEDPILWWSPPKRMLLFPGKMNVSKSLKKSVDKAGFELRLDTEFEKVIRLCGEVPRKGQEGTWVTEPMIQAYVNLHQLGFAHSFETWKNGQLVGGLYGVSLGLAFFGESMFSLVSDASKVAFHHLHEFCKRLGFQFIDCQLYTSHLASLGAREVSRADFLVSLRAALDFPDRNQKWTTL